MQYNDNKYVIIIPSLDPNSAFYDFLQELRSLCKAPVLVVNDGSSRSCEAVFEKISAIENCEVIAHTENRGKGRALKTAFSHCLKKYPDLRGAVTADADGQHRREDIVRCIEVMQQHPDDLILGCRNIKEKNVPWKSRFGNKLTCGVFRYIFGIKLSDTQTGLRGIPADFMKILLDKPGERFEFETIMLLESGNKYNQNTFNISEYTIETVYINDNRASHFRPILDSLKIYAVMGKYLFRQIFLFLLSGVLSAVIDQAVFALLFYKAVPFFKLPGGLILSVVSARCISLVFNYLVNGNVVFPGQKKFFDRKTFGGYLLLCAFIMFSSYGGLKFAHWLLPAVNMLVKKIVIDCLLFFVSYKIQKKIIFKHRAS